MERIKKVVFLILLIFASFQVTGLAANGLKAVPNSKQVDWNPVMDAIIQVESRGDSKAKSGNSVGAMQITPILVAECNQILKRKKSKKRFKLSDRFSISKSKEMFILFQSAYNPLNDIERAIRSWNGGLHFSVKRTQRYLEKVMNVMK
uniref:Transglycosylase SLT domain-containing protein n=1 Tax=Prevotella sp. GTC17260 TaxID=3236796 RepID=A0AB33J9Q7_9BACT